MGLYFQLTRCDIREKLGQKGALRSPPSLKVHGLIWPLEQRAHTIEFLY